VDTADEEQAEPGEAIEPEAIEPDEPDAVPGNEALHRRVDAAIVGWMDRVDERRRALTAPVGDRVDRVWDRATAPLLGPWTRWQTSTVLRQKVPTWAAVVVAVGYLAVFVRLIWWRHERFGSFDYDLGMYDQGIWQLAHGRGFMTSRGMHVFAHHANLGYLLFVPFYWVGLGGPHFLNVVNALAVVATAVPLFLLGRRHLRSSWAGFAFVVAYLFHFSPQWKIQETFHPESLAVAFLAAAWWFASIGRWRWYSLCILGALIWKEDVAIAVAVLGLAIALAHRAPLKGVATSAAGVVWFLAATQLFMPAFQESGAVFDGLFGQLGKDANEVVHTSLVHPSRLWETVQCHGVLDGRPRPAPVPIEGVDCPATLPTENLPPRGWLTLAQPYGVVPAVAAPHVAAVGAPQHVVNYATTADFTWDLRWHYAFLPYLGVVLATVHWVVRRRRAVVSWAAIAVMLVGVGVTAELGIGPWTTNHDSGWWPLTERPGDEEVRALLGRIPDDAAVSASYFLVPHLSHREHIYTFPNPWRSSNFGVGGVPAPPDPNIVEYLVTRPGDLNDLDRAQWDAVVGSGQFERVRDVAGVELWRRVRDGDPPVPPPTP